MSKEKKGTKETKKAPLMTAKEKKAAKKLKKLQKMYSIVKPFSHLWLSSTELLSHTSTTSTII